MILFDLVMAPLSAALGLSIVVERILEFFKNFTEPLIGSHGAREIPEMAETDQKISSVEALYKNSENADAKEFDERLPMSTVLVQDATDADDGTTLRVLILQIFGFAAGIILARISNVQLFHAFLGSSPPIEPWLDYVLTGLLIGGGSGPIHILIRFISERKVSVEAQPVPAAEKDMAAAPAVISKPSYTTGDELDIAYDGGVDRDVLEDVHRRDKDPTMIVYHHTAMSSNSTFEDVVNVIKSRTDDNGIHWITGYNCVVLADGSIKPFCRWDRYGTHAADHNKASLGLAFNGNFETDPKVPFSNSTGNYGPPRPTEVQLKAGARVVALWTFLYRITMDFEKVIIPHKNIAQKACPGSQFPYEDFQKWIAFYCTRWKKSAEMKERVKAFKLKPYLYVKEV